MNNDSSNSWLGNQQWSSGQQPQVQQGQGGWMQGSPIISGGGAGRGEWQAMQQAPSVGQTPSPVPFQPQPGQVPFQAQPSQVPFQAQPGQVPFQPQPGQFPFQGQGTQFHGYAGGGYPRAPGAGGMQRPPQAGGVAGGRGYPSPQQFMTPQQRQQLHQQELERKAKEEQRHRDIEIQRRKMKTMNVSKPSSGALEDLIALPSSARKSTTGSGSSGNNTPVLARADHSTGGPLPEAHPSTSASSKKSTYSPSSKARAWTADTASLEGLFSQHAHAQPPQSSQHEDDFGEFHTGLAPNVPSQHHTGTTTGPDRYGGHLAMASQRPVATTSVSGLTSEGYISTDALQSHSHVSYVQRADTHVAMPPGGGGFSSLDTSKFPRVYVEVYKKCVEGGTGGLLNTERLFPLLLSSQLPTDVLRDLWSQANRGVPGKLNQTELFVLLGLIGLVQSGHPSPTIEDLKRAPEPPVPSLSALQLHKTADAAPPPPVPSSTTTLAPSAGSDEFGDFQQGSALSRAAGYITPSQQVQVATSGQIAQGTASLLTPSSIPASSVSSQAAVISSAFPVSEYKPPADDKYSVFSQLASAPAISTEPQVASSQPPVATSGDKYSVLSQLASAPMSTESQVLASSQPPVATTGDKYSVFTQLASAPMSTEPQVASSQPPVATKYSVFSQLAASSSINTPTVPSVSQSTVQESTSQLATSSSRYVESNLSTVPNSQGSAGVSGIQGPSDGSLDDDFGAFSSGPMPPQSSGVPTKPSASDTSSGGGWANFDSMPPPLPPSTSSSSFTAPASASNSTSGTQSFMTTSTAPSDNAGVFDDPLLKDLQLDKDLKLESHPEKASPETQPKKVAKQLSGLEILDEEMSNRLSAASNEPKDPAPPSLVPLSTLSLVPEPAGPSSSSTSLEKFGEFETYSAGAKEKGEESEGGVSGSSPGVTARSKVGPDPYKVWSSCLDKCLEVLTSCAEVFASVEEVAILEEIAQSEEGRSKLKGIVEVYRLSRRIYYSIKQKNSADSCEKTVEGLKKQWGVLVQTLPGQIMEKLYADTNPSTSEEGATEGDFLSDTISRCSLCLVGKTVCIPAALSLTTQAEDYSLPLVFHEGQMYHAACANFWINVVQEKLPDLSEAF